MPSSHKLDAMLAQYSAGSLTPAMQALVAGHLEMSGSNRRFVAALDAMQGSHLAGLEPQSLAHRAQVLAAVFGDPPPQALAGSADPVFPPALHRLIGKDFNQIKWRRRLPGILEFRVAEEASGQSVVYWIKAGHKIPFHTHEGSEVTLVLKGAFSDAERRYERGDIAIADADVNHQPAVDNSGDCICFAVTDAPLRLTGPVGRIVERLFGHRH